MNIVCNNAVRFLIEFIKLFLTVTVLLKIRQRKSIHAAFLLSLFGVIFVSVFFDFSEFSIIYGFVSIVLLAVNACEKKKAGIIALSFLCISIIDMIFSYICIIVFNLDMNCIQGDTLTGIGLNLFSLVLIILVSLILYKRQMKHRQVRIKKYMPVYIIGCIAISLYLASVQFMEMGESWYVYRDGLVVGMGLGSLTLIALCVLLVINSERNDFLKVEVAVNQEMLEVQKQYYMMLLEKENETKAFRHDIKHHLYCMHNLYSNKKYEELGQYLENMDENVGELSYGIQTGNGLVNAIVNDLVGKHPDVYLKWNGKIPDELCISFSDTCTIFYNILSNAFEAVQEIKGCEVDVDIKYMESAMMIIVKNPIVCEPHTVNGDFISDKEGSGHGYGIRNVKKCVEKNEGRYSAVCDRGYFITEIIIPKVFEGVG